MPVVRKTVDNNNAISEQDLEQARNTIRARVADGSLSEKEGRALLDNTYPSPDYDELYERLESSEFTAIGVEDVHFTIKTHFELNYLMDLMRAILSEKSVASALLVAELAVWVEYSVPKGDTQHKIIEKEHCKKLHNLMRDVISIHTDPWVKSQLKTIQFKVMETWLNW